ncbi:hypothetical protein [Streptomyces sp. NPDC055140]
MFSPDAKATRSSCSGTTPSRARAPPPASVCAAPCDREETNPVRRRPGRGRARAPSTVAALGAPLRSSGDLVRVTPDDAALTAVLKRDGRAGYPELQRGTGRSESSVKRRLDQLIASGSLYIDRSSS